MRPKHLRLVVDNGRRVPPPCDDAYLDFCEALQRWQAVRKDDPHNPLRLEALAAFQRYAPDVAATLDPKIWGRN